MGFLRERVIKGVRYFYWCERKRDKKKQGGSGKVKSSEILLGGADAKWLGYYAYVGDIPTNEVIKKLTLSLVRKDIDLSKTRIIFDFTSTPPSIQIRGTKGMDFRREPLKTTRDLMAIHLKSFARQAYYFEDNINRAKDFYTSLSTSVGKDEAIEDVLQTISKLLSLTPKKYRKEMKERLTQRIFN